MRKNAQVLQLERRHGKDIREIVRDAYNEAGSIHGAAAALGVNPNTFSYWKMRLGVETRRVAAV